MRRKKPLTIKTYTVIARAVEEGVAYGLQRYNKHNSDTMNRNSYGHDIPLDVDAIAEHLEREVLNALCEVIDFGDE